MISLRGSRLSLFKCYRVPPQNTAASKITDPREIFLRSGRLQSISNSKQRGVVLELGGGRAVISISLSLAFLDKLWRYLQQ